MMQPIKRLMAELQTAEDPGKSIQRLVIATAKALLLIKKELLADQHDRLNEFLCGKDRSDFVGLAIPNFGRSGPRRCKASICVDLGAKVMLFFVVVYLLFELCIDL